MTSPAEETRVEMRVGRLGSAVLGAFAVITVFVGSFSIYEAFILSTPRTLVNSNSVFIYWPGAISWSGIVSGSFLLFVVTPAILVQGLWNVNRVDPLSSDMRQWFSARAKINRLELILIACLVILACGAFAISYFATRAVFISMQLERFGPAETAEVIAAVGGSGLAIGAGIAAIIKAYALLIRARADFVRAKLSLPPGEDIGTRAGRQLSGRD